MRKSLALLFSICIGAAPFLNAAEENVRENSNRWLKISIDVPFAFFGAYLPQAEFKLTDRISAVAELGLINPKWTIMSDVNQLPGIFGKIAAGLRFYATGNAMNGFFLQDTLQLDYGRSYTGEAGIFTFFGGQFPYEANMWLFINRLDAGYAWVGDCGLSIDAYASLVVLAYRGIPNPPFIGEMVHTELGLRLGYAF
jgi:hypothetical protein